MHLFLRTPIVNIVLLLLCSSYAAAATSQNRDGSNSAKDLPDFTFNLTRVPENPSRYSVVISDSDEHVISATFSLAQLEVFKTVLLEAESFALNGDGVGTKEPATTRFRDSKEQALFVDVEKLGNQSRLFVTLVDDSGIQTVEAGRVFRNTRREIGFFFDLLSSLESLLPKAPVKSP
jgi:hypothetical protein